jgi:hypothetical protein
MAAIFRAYGLRGTAELIDPIIGVDRVWDERDRLQHSATQIRRRKNDARRGWPGQLHPSIGSRCAWRGAAAGDEAVFEFEEGEGR